MRGSTDFRGTTLTFLNAVCSGLLNLSHVAYPPWCMYVDSGVRSNRRIDLSIQRPPVITNHLFKHFLRKLVTELTSLANKNFNTTGYLGNRAIRIFGGSTRSLGVISRAQHPVLQTHV